MIRELTLHDFRSYERRTFSFTEPCLIFFGGNGQGKTNILEAISILSTGKSWRETSARDLIRQESESALIQAKLTTGDQYQIIIQPRSRQFTKNEKKIALKQHFGTIPTLLFVPEHLTLFSDNKRARQRFFDRFLFQIDPHYRDMLSHFNRALKHKNALLKQEHITPDQLRPWNTILSETIPQIHQARLGLLRELNPLLQTRLDALSSTSEPIRITLDQHGDYEPTQEGLQAFFQAQQRREIAAQRTLIGPHRDDFLFSFRDKPILSSASRGEERSVLLALLAAKKHLLKAKIGIAPMLLLDDVFSELDQNRQDHLEALCDGSQVFFTTTHESHFENFSLPMKKFQISNSK